MDKKKHCLCSKFHKFFYEYWLIDCLAKYEKNENSPIYLRTITLLPLSWVSLKYLLYLKYIIHQAGAQKLKFIDIKFSNLVLY